jgi:ABC-2 type transport system ATP-binding protein
MLEVRDVTKIYGDRAVVQRVTFDVESGEVFALLGPNGAGKTTLIRMITDILRPDSGAIRFDGRPMGSAIKHELAYLPEERGLYRRSKVMDVLVYFGQLKGLSDRDARQASKDLLARVELGEWGDKQVQALSKGMQQKVQLCTALIGKPRLLILDEPFSGLDPINVQLFEDILHEMRRAGSTVLLSTHQMSKVEEVCDRALMINRGHMVLYGSVREIRRQHADHAVVVRAEGSFDGLPGVRSVEAANGDRKLTLEPDATPESVLRALLERGVKIESFARAELPLEDIFVKVVREGIGLDHGLSGPPTVDEVTAKGAPR